MRLALCKQYRRHMLKGVSWSSWHVKRHQETQRTSCSSPSYASTLTCPIRQKMWRKFWGDLPHSCCWPNAPRASTKADATFAAVPSFIFIERESNVRREVLTASGSYLCSRDWTTRPPGRSLNRRCPNLYWLSKTRKTMNGRMVRCKDYGETKISQVASKYREKY